MTSTIDLRLGGCLDVMRGMVDKSVDLVFTSPPFKNEDVTGDYWVNYSKWFAEMSRVASKVIFIIHSSTKINRLMHDYPPKRLMIWGKGFSQYSYRFNPMLVYQIDPKYSVNRRIWSDCFAVPSMTKYMEKKVHKYQDPEALYDAIFKMFGDCQTVLDPFCGSATSGVVSLKLGKDYIGIERDPECFTIAQRRIAAAQAQMVLPL